MQFSHLTTLAAQTISGPGADTLPYLYDQSDLLGDDWLQIDHHFKSGLLSFKYDLGTESLTTNYVQGQVTAEGVYQPDSSFTSAPMVAARRRCKPFRSRKRRVRRYCATTATRLAKSTIRWPAI